jgi:gluconokinase
VVKPPLVVVGGVSGSGKSVLGEALAGRLGVPYADGDDFHSPANVAKMASGQPLRDDEREPWLDAIGRWLAEHAASGAVMSCSALSRHHRSRLLDHAGDAVFCQLRCSKETLTERLAGRSDHFMPSSLLASQLAALEPLERDEPGVVLDCSRPVDDLVADVVRWLSCAEPPPR